MAQVRAGELQGYRVTGLQGYRFSDYGVTVYRFIGFLGIWIKVRVRARVTLALVVTSTLTLILTPTLIIGLVLPENFIKILLNLGFTKNDAAQLFRNPNLNP